MLMTEEPRPRTPRPKTTVGKDSCADEALGVETFVVPERGRWAVDIVVVFADGVVRKRIDTHATRARASHAFGNVVVVVVVVAKHISKL